jgi:transposase
VVRAQLRGQGWRINTGSAHTFVRRARALELDELMAEILEPLLSSIDKLTEEIKAADKWFESSSKDDEEIYLAGTLFLLSGDAVSVFSLSVPLRN